MFIFWIYVLHLDQVKGNISERVLSWLLFRQSTGMECCDCFTWYCSFVSTPFSVILTLIFTVLPWSDYIWAVFFFKIIIKKTGSDNHRKFTKAGCCIHSWRIFFLTDKPGSDDGKNFTRAHFCVQSCSFFLLFNN